MCPECKEEINKDTCTRCGKVIEKENNESSFERNKSFDEERFKALAGE